MDLNHVFSVPCNVTSWSELIMDDLTPEDADREYLRAHPAKEMLLWKEWVLVVCGWQKEAPPTAAEWDALTAKWHHEKMPVTSFDELRAMRRIISAPSTSTPLEPTPIDMVLYCPACGLQHVDGPEDLHDIEGGCDIRGRSPWENPPHRSHLCHRCGHIWRPADVPTNGVAAIKTRGKRDSPIVSPARPHASSS